MNLPVLPSKTTRNLNTRVMDENQFNQVIEAILSGKYSWACVLILKFAGYNPLHYIPYRTYNRLLKENQQYQPRRSGLRPVDEAPSLSQTKGVTPIRDLCYFEKDDHRQEHITGGSSNWYLAAAFCRK